jgi:hypothetical protein
MSDQLLTHVEFRSNKFPAFEGEQDVINPDLWGKLLADFLREGLLSRGYDVGEPVPEDWGWMLHVPKQPFSMWIGCGHYQEYPDGFLCFIEPSKPYIWRSLRRIKTVDTVKALQLAVDAVLVESAGIRSKKWWTHDEFNLPSKHKVSHQD